MRRGPISSNQTEPSVLSEYLPIRFSKIFLLIAIGSVLLSAQDKPARPPTESDAASQLAAKPTYESVCAACHGLDARGSERGPDIVSKPEIVHKTDAELLEILRQGKTAAGMPSFASYGSDKLSGIVAYLRMMQGRGKDARLPGNPTRGKDLFFGKAKCAECHMVDGQGGFFAQDLTSYATTLDANDVRAKIVNPDKNLDPRRGLVHVVLLNATELTGVARNQDNFSIQLQTLDGTFHLLNKSDIRSRTYTGRSAMPSDYGSVLSSAELDDLVSYLLRASVTGNRPKPAGNPGETNED